MSTLRFFLAGLSTFLVWPMAQTVAQSPATAAQLELFESKVRPVLADNCFQCHSAAKKQKANLLLDSRAGLMHGGDSGPAAVPGQPEKSRLVKAIRYDDPELRMPPRSKLSDQQIADLTRWIEQGAPWPNASTANPAGTPSATFDLKERAKAWAFQPVKSYAPPKVHQTGWLRSPVDAFILARLESVGLSPAQAADKRVLIRRLSFDLLGLPPTPADIDAFLIDEAPDAWERVVDRFLASPHYGERWGRHWLDLVRYAETCGHEFDGDLPEAHRYRDYIIRAFNADNPYDRIVIEHVAGDLLPQPRLHPGERYNESILATGFWFLGEAKHSPVDVRGDEADRIDNQIDVFGKTFLGLTIACARCHDHKFDPIPTRDYYALCGYLQSSRFQQAFLDPPDNSRALRERLAETRAISGRLATSLAVRHLRAELEQPSDSQLLAWISHEKARTRPVAADAFADFRKEGYRDWFVTGQAFGGGPSKGAEMMPRADALLPLKRFVEPGVAHSGLVSSRLQGALRSQTFPLTRKRIWFLASGKATQINLILDGFQHIRDPIYGGLTIRLKDEMPRWLSMDIGMWQGHRAYVEVLDDGDGYAAVERIVLQDDPTPPEAVNGLLIKLQVGSDPTQRLRTLLREIVEQAGSDKLAGAPDAADRIDLLNRLLQLTATKKFEGSRRDVDRSRLEELLRECVELEGRLSPPRRGLAMADGTGENERIFIRGNHKNLGEEAPRRLLEVLAGPEQPAPVQGSGRLELAYRLVQPSNPLLARVLVNRMWQHLFGEGIVRSPDNFGALGDKPSHPELLDFLASEFRRADWSIKHLHRLLLQSSTYQLASRSDRATDERDPENRLFHRMPIRRLEAEAIRDAMLYVSGRLDRRMYGMGIPPYLTSFMLGRGRPGSSGPLDGDGRRSIYLGVRRNFLTPMFLAFDYPVPFTTIGRRSVSNVPAQALTMMNNPLVVQQAQQWARRALIDPNPTDRVRLDNLYIQAFGRHANEEELVSGLQFLCSQRQRYAGSSELQVWSDLCHVLLNVKEFIFLN